MPVESQLAVGCFALAAITSRAVAVVNKRTKKRHSQNHAAAEVLSVALNETLRVQAVNDYLVHVFNREGVIPDEFDLIVMNDLNQ